MLRAAPFFSAKFGWIIGRNGSNISGASYIKKRSSRSAVAQENNGDVSGSSAALGLFVQPTGSESGSVRFPPVLAVDWQLYGRMKINKHSIPRNSVCTSLHAYTEVVRQGLACLRALWTGSTRFHLRTTSASGCKKKAAFDVIILRSMYKGVCIEFCCLNQMRQLSSTTGGGGFEGTSLPALCVLIRTQRPGVFTSTQLQLTVEGNSALTKKRGTARQGWMPLSHGEGNVVFYILLVLV